MMAATLDLPINNNLGFAYIVPYKRKFKNGQGQWTETLEAQFQMGYKGFIQLAQRSGQFARIAATPVYQGQLISANPLLGYEFDWTVENKGEAIGYVAFFKLLNGFTAELYMSTADVKKHAGKYSQSFKYGSGVWKDNFEAMALKTVTKLLLSKQAPLSIDMQTAQLADQSIVHDVENSDFKYIDHSDAVAAIEQKPTVPDNEFPVLLEQIRAGALEKDYVFGEYQLTDDQTAKVHAL